MYQQEELTEFAQRGLPYIDCGVNGKVWDCGNGTIIKISRRDDITRNWLEFCVMMRETGRMMPLMPEVYYVIDAYRIEDERRFCDVTNKWVEHLVQKRGYAMSMKKYKPQERGTIRWGAYERELTTHSGFSSLANEFKAYMMRRTDRYFDLSDLFGDLHGGNIMMDGKRPVITDPSNGTYVEPAVPKYFQLDLQ